MQCLCTMVIIFGFSAARKKVLAIRKFNCHNDTMTKHIRKVTNYHGIMRITIPRKVVLKKRWSKVQYVIIDDQHPDRLEIRRFVDEEHLNRKTK